MPSRNGAVFTTYSILTTAKVTLALHMAKTIFSEDGEITPLVDTAEIGYFDSESLRIFDLLFSS